MSISVVIAAGGTAGHVYPGLAVADALRRMRPDARISFVGTPRGIERDAVPAAGYPVELLDVIPWSRTLGAKRYAAPFSALAASTRARALLGRLAPHAVVGMGGYASLPVVLAARTRRIPTLLHEQNAIPGIANVVGVRAARRIGVTFPESRDAFPRAVEVRVVGNPLRSEIASLDRTALRDEGCRAFGLDPTRRTILVTGGSLGAARLNEAAAGLAHRWRDRSDLQMLISAGREHGEALQARIAAAGTGALIVSCRDYLERVELAYASAEVAVCRAGAATVMELAAVGLPGILVPYPFARANHQEANARSLERAGGARVVLDRDASADSLGSLLDALLADDEARDVMAKAARSFAKPRAADDMAAWVLSLAEERGVPRAPSPSAGGTDA